MVISRTDRRPVFIRAGVMEIQRQYRMRKNAQFQHVYRRGRAVSGTYMTLLHVPARSIVVGFSVSRKVGGSVGRNRVKRRLREAFRMTIPELKVGSYVLVAKPLSSGAAYRDLERELRALLHKARLVREDAHAG